MKEHKRVLGVGLALVDNIIFLSPETLGKDVELAKSEKFAGGVVPNILDSIDIVPSSFGVRLLACVGNDELGSWYRGQTEHKMGDMQVKQYTETGVSQSFIDKNGKVIYRDTKYHAAKFVEIPENELGPDILVFITDIYTLNVLGKSSQIVNLLRAIKENAGLFALNLAGLHVMNPSFLIELFGSFFAPDIICGNQEEFKHLSDSDDPLQQINTAFPSSKICANTLGSRGSIVRTASNILYVPPFGNFSDVEVKSTGAGDCYMGVFLSSLLTLPVTDWDNAHVEKSALTASFAASIVAKNTRIRLDQNERTQITDFYNSLV